MFDQRGQTVGQQKNAGDGPREQVPSIGRVVHFVYGGEHYAAIITAVHSRQIEGDNPPVYGQTLFVMPPMDAPFSAVATLDPDCAPATWHWPEFVPPK